MTQIWQHSSAKHETNQRRFLRAVPAAVGLLVPRDSIAQRVNTATAERIVSDAVLAPQKDAPFIVEWMLPDNTEFTPYGGNGVRAADRARDLETLAESIARSFPGRKVRVLRRGAARATLCFRFNAATGAMGTY